MNLYFRIRLKKKGEELQVIDYPLSEVETEKLFQQVGRDFLSIAASVNDFARLELDVIFEDFEMVERVVTLLSDMFPSALKLFKNQSKNKRMKKDKLIKAFIEDSSCFPVQYDDIIELELDKFFMLFYLIVAQRDSTNIARNITNKLHKIGINTINSMPFVGKLELDEYQINRIKEKAIRTSNIQEHEHNFFVLDSNSSKVQKLTSDDTHYYYYIYKGGRNFVKNYTNKFYMISIVAEPEQKGFNVNVKFEDTEKIYIDDMYTRCKLFNDLCNCSRELETKEILGLLSNLHNTVINAAGNLVQGVNYIIDRLQDCQKEIWKFLIPFIKGTNYISQNCREYCHYCDSCTHAKTMLRTVHIKKNTIEKIDREENYVTVEESREELQQVMTSAYNSLENDKTDLELIIAPPGIGKTEKVIDIIVDGVPQGKSYIYAIPNRMTIDNFVERLEKRNFKNYIVTPTLDEILDEKRKKKIKQYQNLGIYIQLSNYIREEIEKIEAMEKEQELDKVDKIDYEIMKTYIDVNESLKYYEGLVVTTHHRVSFFEKEVYQNKICFIDEDIFDTDFVKTVEMPLNKIRNVYQASARLTYNYFAKLKILLDMPANVIQPIVQYDVSIKDKKIIEKDIVSISKNATNIFDFLRCDAVKKYVTSLDNTIVKCFIFNKLPPCPVMITSATACDEFYQREFCYRKLDIHHIKKAKYKGKIIMWDSHTYSETFMLKDDNLEYFKELLHMCYTENMNLITFKEFIKKYQEIATDSKIPDTDPRKHLLDGIKCYNFFSMLGIDSLGDKNGAVIGKPLKNDEIFYYFALRLYKKQYSAEEVAKQKCQTQVVQDKGFMFNLYTYLDETLRKIQMWSISSNQEQYTGRGRVYDNPERTMYVASGYPVEQMIIEEDDGFKGIGVMLDDIL